MSLFETLKEKGVNKSILEDNKNCLDVLSAIIGREPDNTILRKDSVELIWFMPNSILTVSIDEHPF